LTNLFRCVKCGVSADSHGIAGLSELVILGDIGYVQQSAEEMEVLFTFLAERDERRGR